MSCQAKHTKYQPTPKQWKCPKCGIGPPDGLCIYESAYNADGDCDLLHGDDYLRCNTDRCDFDMYGRAFAAKAQRAASMIPCAHCKGTGSVKK